MAIDTTIRRFTPPSGDLTRAHIAKISQALNQIEGLHSGVVPQDVQLAADDRWLTVGPQTVPTGITVTLAPGAVWVTL